MRGVTDNNLDTMRSLTFFFAAVVVVVVQKLSICAGVGEVIFIILHN